MKNQQEYPISEDITLLIISDITDLNSICLDWITC